MKYSKRSDDWLKYILWIVSIAFAIVLVIFFINLMNNKIFKEVPDGYKFSVTDFSTENHQSWTTYYIYDDSILADTTLDSDQDLDRIAIIYYGIDTSELKLNENDTYESCNKTDCYKYPKVLAEIKKLIVGKVSREYTRL